MHITLTGLSYRTAPLAVRESLAFPGEQLSQALPRFAEVVGDGIILWTCNRTEVYAVSDAPAATAERVRGFLASHGDLEPGAADPYLYDYTDLDAARHLFSVAGGLDSMVLGESEILGQVRQALTAASASSALPTSLSRLFHRAIRTGRRVRDETGVGRNAISISQAGVRLAERVVGGLHDARVTLIGAGEAGQLVAKALQSSGVVDLRVTNRTHSRALEVTRQLGGRAVPFARLGQQVSDSDVVIAATEAPEYVVTVDMVASAAQARRNGGLMLLDLAVPRNVDPEAASLEGVRLFNIDDLSSIAEENLKGRRTAAKAAAEIVEEEAIRFMRWWDSRDAVPIIKAVRARGERIRSAELKRALSKLDSVSTEDVAVLEAMSRAIVTKLLHDPTKRLKKRSDGQYLEAAMDLFQIADPEE